MIQLNAQGKNIDTEPIKHLFTQGEHFSDKVRILIDKVNNETDVSDCTFVMRTVAVDGSMTEAVLSKEIQDESILLTWEISETAAAVSGVLLLELIGSKDAETVIKYKMPPIFIKEAVMGTNIPVPDVIDAKLAEMNELLEDAEDISKLISSEGGAVQEVIDARTSSISGVEFSSLSNRLTADFSTCVTQGELESALGNTIITANNTGVGRLWRDENGVAYGEIFGDYTNNEASYVHTTAMGYKAIASSAYAIAIGTQVAARGMISLAMGFSSGAVGRYSIAIGSGATANADNTVAIGTSVTASSESSIVLGKRNIADTEGKYVLIVGNGDSSASNGLTLTWDGTLWAAGDVTATDSGGASVSLITADSKANSALGSITDLLAADAVTESTLGTQKKNLLKNTAGTTTQNGIAFTLNADGSVTCSGTATADTNYRYSVTLHPNTSYTLTGCPSEGGTSTYNLFAMDTDSWSSIHRDTGSGKTFSTGTHTGWQIIIRIASGQTVEGLTFYPMLRRTEITDSTYEPYTPSLQEQIDELKAQIAAMTAVVTTTNETEA